MALLKNGSSQRDARWHNRLLLTLLGGVLTGCALVNVFSGQAKPYGFNHAIHQKEGLECVDCHATVHTEDSPGMPTRGGCDLCHAEIDQKKPPERRIDLLFDGDVYKAQHVSKLGDERVFSHLRHANQPNERIDCKSCHVGIEQNEFVNASLAVDMQECRSCHTRENVANECSTCHHQLRVDTPPDSHLFQWKKMHGPTVRAHDTAMANNCSLCHSETSCKTCHQTEQPDSHDNFFRLRGHGLLARMDRQNCAACHRADSCDACHQDTRPLSHTGTFATSQQTHCIGCHLPVQQNDCFTCHKTTPSHEMAPPKPADHAPGMNCRMCHGVGQILPHVDNGDDCNACHR